MNILIFDWRDITHPWGGGAGRLLHELAKRWFRWGHNVTILAGGYPGALPKETIDGIEIIRTGGTYSIFLFAPFYYFFFLRDRKFDFVVDTSHGVSFFTPLFCRLPKIFIIHHNHQKLWETEIRGIKARVGIFIENKIVPWLYRNIQIVTHSSSSRDSLVRVGFNKVVSVAPGIDNKFFRPGKKAKRPVIVYLGRLRKYKRIDMLLDIFPELKKKIPNLLLVIAGYGQDRARLEHLVREKKLESSVSFKGYVSEEEKLKLLQEAWVLAFPSMIEGWGLVAMEAAACGTPTVGFRVQGLVDAVRAGVSGILVNTKKEFTQTLIKILEDYKLRKDLSVGAYKWSKNFNWEKSAKEVLEVMEREKNR